jgi:hypothetical protein
VPSEYCANDGDAGRRLLTFMRRLGGNPMAKYDPLGRYLARRPKRPVVLSFEQIDGIISSRLPNSAYTYRPFWANNANGHVHAAAWLGAGWRVTAVDLARKTVIFGPQ